MITLSPHKKIQIVRLYITALSQILSIICVWVFLKTNYLGSKNYWVNSVGSIGSQMWYFNVTFNKYTYDYWVLIKLHITSINMVCLWHKYLPYIQYMWYAKTFSSFIHVPGLFHIIYTYFGHRRRYNYYVETWSAMLQLLYHAMKPNLWRVLGWIIW